MIRIIKVLRKCVCIPGVIGIYLIVAVSVVYCGRNHQDIVYGLPVYDSNEMISLRLLAGWLLIMFFPHIINGVIVFRCENVKTYMYIRIRKRSGYNMIISELCIINSMLWGIILLLVHSFHDKSYFLILACLFLSHLVLWTISMILFVLIFRKNTLGIILSPLLCVIMIGIAGRTDKLSPYIISSYGMLSRTKIFMGEGLSPYVYFFANVIIIFVCMLIVQKNKRYIWREYHGKNNN